MLSETSVFVDGVEMSGFILYGLWAGTAPSATAIELKELRRTTTSLRALKLTGDRWQILMFEAAFSEDATYRTAAMEHSRWLQEILRDGAQVAWLGSAGLPFADPPELFTAEWMEGGVLAAQTLGGALYNGVDREGFTPLSNAQMRVLEAVAQEAIKGSG